MQIVRLKQRSTHIFVKHLSKLLYKEILPTVSVVFLYFSFGRIKSPLVNGAEELQRILVHWINVLQVRQNKEQPRNTNSNWYKLSSDQLDLIHCLLHFFQLTFNLLALLLRFIQGCIEFIVF